MPPEASAPPIDAHPAWTAYDLLASRVASAPEHVAFGRRTSSGLLDDVTTAEFAEECRALARGLVAQGVAPGDRVAVMAPTRYERAVADFAIWAAGAVVVPLYETASAAQVAAIVAETRPVLALAGSAAQVAVLADAAPDLSCWSMDPLHGRDLAALAASGVGVPDDRLDAAGADVRPDDVATIVYTSGTTGRQKGVRITHANLVSEVLGVAHDYAELINDRAVTIVVLPLAHILARGLQAVAVGAGMKVVHEPDRARVLATFGEVKPTFLVVVPALLVRIRAAARAKAAKARLGAVWRLAESTAIEWSRHLEARQDDPSLVAPRGLRLRRALFAASSTASCARNSADASTGCSRARRRSTNRCRGSSGAPASPSSRATA